MNAWSKQGKSHYANHHARVEVYVGGSGHWYAATTSGSVRVGPFRTMRAAKIAAYGIVA